MKKVAIVTGGSRGIGLSIVQRLLEDDYAVLITASGSAEKYAKTLQDLKASAKPVFYVQADVSRQEDRERILQGCLSEFRRIDLLVNNAGVAPLERRDLLEMSEESFDRVLGINTKGALFLSQIVAKQMLKQEMLFKKRGTIINITSCSSVVSSVNRGEYCISKAAASMVTTLFADRLAGEGILVHEVRPGVIATDMTSKVEEKYSKLIEEGLFPIARWGQPEDVANAVSALASDDFLYTTGNYIDVDGAFHIKRL
ncbi:MAG: 3-ketoacyl-ACP reductase [Anaerolineaceae bacterium]|nr:3-ketoacyl-ACP reductase [Anaerolineaceae bacterium]